MACSSVLLLLVATAAIVCGEYEKNTGEYKFSYGVKDPHTGDNHEQREVSDGHVVKGAYTLKEADGTRRIVEYVAGPHSGFNAVVHRVGHAQHPQHYGKPEMHQTIPDAHLALDNSNDGAHLQSQDGGEYKFAYGVKDPHTGDNHEQHEVSDGHVVKGSYSLQEADGTKRVVDYVADPHHGFNAIVQRIGHANHPKYHH